MKKITFLFAFLLTLVGYQSHAQYGCASGIPITDGYTATGITSPGTGGPEDWNDPNPSTINMCQNATGAALSPSYFADDVYLFTYTAGANDEEVSMTINSLTTWTGLGIFASCTGTFLDDCMGSSGSTSGGVLTATATVSSGQTVYIAVGQWGTPNALNFDVTSFSAIPLVNPPSCTILSAPLDGATDVAIIGNLTWASATGGATEYNLEVGTSSGASDVFSGAVGNVTTYNVGTLAYSSTYFVTITPSNANGPATGCTEESFMTIAPPPTGSICSDPIVIGSLPYSVSDNTANYGDDYSGAPGTTCGTTSAYLGGDDVVYAYTATSDTAINVSMSPTATWSGIFVYTDCADIGVACANGIANSATTERNFDLNVTTGTTYYFVISTYPSPQSTEYSLVITENTCVGATVVYTVVNDCDLSGGFLIDVEVTDMGSATSLTVSDDQGSASQQFTSVGTMQFGPYTNATDVIFTVDDEGDDDSCTLTSSALTQVACPPANDECADATALIPGATYGENAVDGILVGATYSGFTNTCGGTTAISNDVWYSVVVPADGNITIETGADIATSNPGNDTAFEVYSGDCGTLTSLGCDDDGAATGLFSLLDLTGLTPDSTIYVRVWGYLNTQLEPFSISAYNLSLSINELSIENLFSYYPNPVNNTFSLRAVKAIQNVAVYNMLGQEVLRSAPNTVDSDLDMSSLNAGTYFVKVTIENATKTIKIIKK
ncbi:T9SS type A sorting domain-containing protein [Bizionia arctica]|uniref:T9SS C-terminal target domain-containing protein n=1 Tax=Bizionia arctica TaxID=1495645 RepID=A0A917GF33_9FLAO|nr:T9SS type A sorting domain-containing protein [Bizionia arctica]GGG43015.1 T9SS C-terminal target domain-containing protein [Bizionia arctica]